jgi:hypothetical protein
MLHSCQPCKLLPTSTHLSCFLIFKCPSDEAISAQEPILKANASNTCAAVGLISTSLPNPPPWSDQFGLPSVVPVVQTPVAPVIPIPTLVDSVENNSGAERAAGIAGALSVVVAFLLV